MTEKETSSVVEPTRPEKSAKPVIRQWRVGTMSMGLTLVILGLVIFLGKMNETYSITWLLKFWPLILVVLGLEMVLLNFLTTIKGGRYRFTYDILSIFLVFMLIFLSSSFLVMESTGVMELAQRSLWMSEHHIESEKVLYTADESVKALSLRVEGRRTNLRTYEGNEIRALAVYKGHFASREEGLQYADQQYVQVERVGDTLMVTIYPPGRGYLPRDYVEQEITVFIPSHLDVEITQLRGDVQVALQELASNWVINQQAVNRHTDIILDGVANTRLSVEIKDQGRLQGNIQWDSELNEEEFGAIEAVKTWGEGKYSLVLHQTSGTIVANVR